MTLIYALGIVVGIPVLLGLLMLPLWAAAKLEDVNLLAPLAGVVIGGGFIWGGISVGGAGGVILCLLGLAAAGIAFEAWSSSKK